MNIKKTKLSILMILMLSVSGYAKTWSDIRDMIEKKYSGFSNKIKDMTMEQEIVMNINDSNITGAVSYMKMYTKGDKFRLETSVKLEGLGEQFGGAKSYMIKDGDDIWSISPYTGKQKIDPSQIDVSKTEQNWWSFLPEKGEVKGIETINGVDCYMVDFLDNEETMFTSAWIDKKNLLMIRAEIIDPMGEISILMQSDFRKIYGDFKWPYKTEMYKDARLFMKMTVKKLTVNSGLPDSLFDPDNIKIENKSFDMEQIMKMMQQQKKMDKTAFDDDNDEDLKKYNEYMKGASE